jgi:Na+/H+ antiporter NhaA
MGLATFLIVLAVVASALPSRRGWATAAVTGGLGAIAVGVVSLAPSDAGSALPMWAVALAVAWGVAVVGITFARSRPAATRLQAHGQPERPA